MTVPPAKPIVAKRDWPCPVEARSQMLMNMTKSKLAVGAQAQKGD
jgi:hypothetical protein